MRVLITGGAGFLGSHLSDAFLARGDEVFVLDAGATAKVRHLIGHQRFRLVRDSVLSPDILDSLIAQVDLVYHLAAVVGVEHYVGDPYEVLNVNVNGTQNVLKTAFKYGRKVVFSSTSEVYGRNPRVPWSEDDDRVLGSTVRASVSSTEAQANGGSARASISADGRFVAFHSDATNLVVNDTNDTRDVFVRDLQEGVTTRVSVSSTGSQATGGSSSPFISADGRYVLFASRYDPGSATLLAAAQVYRLDRDRGSVLRLSSDALGQPGNANSYAHDLSADGRYAVFSTDAGNLVGAAAGYGQVYRHDAVTGLRELVSGDSAGQPTAPSPCIATTRPRRLSLPQTSRAQAFIACWTPKAVAGPMFPAPPQYSGSVTT